MLISFYISVPGNFMPNAKLHFPKGADAAALLPCLTAVRNTDFFVCVQIDSCSWKDFQIPPRVLELFLQ